MQKSSQSPQTSTQIIPSREQHAALFTVINKSRLLNGWTTRTAQELDPTIRIWNEMFLKYQIPVAAYQELYERAFDTRQKTLQMNPKHVPQMDATLLVSHWTGEHGLRAELKRREIERGRTLANNAESQCQKCFGSGCRTVVKDNYTFAVKCDHGNG